MIISESRLRNIIRKALLTEEIFGSQAFVYHGTNIEPEIFFAILESGRFRPGQGDIFGKGLYSVTDTSKDVNTIAGHYGKYIYKLKVNLNGFVVFDADACKKIYGRWIPLREQLKALGFEREVKNLEKQKNKDELVSLEDNPSAVLDLGDDPVPEGISTDQFALAMYRSLFSKKPAMGMIFTRNRGGTNDGQVVVIYEPQIVVPVSWKEAGQESWNKFDELPKASLSRSWRGTSPTKSSAKDFNKEVLRVIYDQMIDDGNANEYGRKNYEMESLSQIERNSVSLNSRDPLDMPEILKKFINLFYYLPPEAGDWRPKKLTKEDIEKVINRAKSEIPELEKLLRKRSAQ